MNALSADFAVGASLPLHARVAILVDGDNFPHSEVHRLEAVAATMGEVISRRVFGDVKKVGGWPEAVNYQMLHCDTSCGKKNLADMQLTVAVMDMAHRGLATGFVIASDDRDFQPVIQYLIESGFAVLRLRKQVVATSPPCNPQKIATPVLQKTKLSDVDVAVDFVLKGYLKGLSLFTIGSTLKNGTVKAQTGKKTWRAYFASKPDLYVLDGTGRATLVRLKRPAPHTAP